MKTIAGEVVAQLAQRGVRVVFGIPGVHTLELYRGLAAAGIRHVPARHEQGAGFMADGYARATGEPGVALVITGPGLTNTLTAMAQARADSVPMIVVSGVNARPSLGRGLGFLHELPNQRGVARLVALRSERIETATDVVPMVADAFAASTAARPGPSPFGPGPIWPWTHLGPGPILAYLGRGPFGPWGIFSLLGPGPVWPGARLGPWPICFNLFGPGPVWAQGPFWPRFGLGPISPRGSVFFRPRFL